MAIKITTLFEDASKQTALAPRTKVSAVSNENGVGLSELLNGKVSTAYATCSTAAATAAKVVTIEGNTNWSLVTGTVIYVKFTETNTAENPTINVNSTGAKSVVLNGTTITTSSLSYAGYANRIISYIYNGTQWAFNGWSYDGNTDTKVQQNAVITTAKEYPVLLAYSDSTAKVTNAVNKAAGFTYNPSTQILTAPTFKGALSGNANSATTLTGLTATVTELNYVDGVTSNIQTQLNNKMSSRPTCIELGGSADSVVNEGFIDFHFNNSSSDYTSRIIESASGALEVNSVKFSGGKVTSGTWNGSAIGVAYGGTGLTASPSMLINLGSTSAANVLQASPRPGVTGTLAVANGGTGATTAAGALKNLGLTATAAELNYCDGVTSNIQTQLNGKSSTSHNHDSTYVNVSGDTMTGNLTINLAGARSIYNNGTRSM